MRAGILTDVMTTIGENIKRLRQAAGFKTQGALAQALGVPQARLSDWENGRYDSIETDKLVHIAKVLAVSIDTWLAGVDPVYDQIATVAKTAETDGSRVKVTKNSNFDRSLYAAHALSSPPNLGGFGDAASTRIQQLEGRLAAYEGELYT